MFREKLFSCLNTARVKYFFLLVEKRTKKKLIESIGEQMVKTQGHILRQKREVARYISYLGHIPVSFFFLLCLFNNSPNSKL